MIKTEIKFILNNNPVFNNTEPLGPNGNKDFKYYTYAWSGNSISTSDAIYPSLYNDDTLQSINVISGWTWNNGWMVSDSGSTEPIYQEITNIETEKYYKVIFSLKDSSGPGGITPYLYGNSGTTVYYDGQYTQIIYIENSGDTFLTFLPETYFTGGISNIQVLGTSAQYRKIDIYNDEDFSLTYQIQTKISNKAASYSKTITLPGTQNNNIIFNELFNESLFVLPSTLNETMFLNKKIPAGIYNDTVEIMIGFFELNKVLVNNKQVEYEGVFYSNIKNIADVIGDSMFVGNDDSADDIDFSEYNHTFCMENIKYTWPVSQWGFVPPVWNSFGNYVVGNVVNYLGLYYICLVNIPAPYLIPSTSTYFWKPINYYAENKGPYYPVIDYANYRSGNEYRIQQFKPCLYVKQIWDKVFDNAGFTYTSNFINSTDFKSLVIPQGNETRERNLANQNFSVGLDFNQDLTLPLPMGCPLNQYPSPVLVEYTKTDDPFFNPNNVFDTIVHRWKVTKSGKQDFKALVRYGIRIDTQGGSQWQPWYSNANNIKIRLVIYKSYGSYNQFIQDGDWYVNNIPNLWYNSGQWVVAEEENAADVELLGYDCSVGDEFYVMAQIQTNGFITYYPASPSQLPSTIYVRLGKYESLRNDDPSSFSLLKSELTWYYLSGETVYMNDTLPNIKQIDFLSSVCSKFNLIFTEDKNNSNNLIIEPFDDFYSGSTYKNWNTKVDLNGEKWIEKIPDLNEKRLQFALTNDDADQLLKEYTSSSNKTFGDKLIENPYYAETNEIVSDVFSPTMLVYYGSTQMIVSRIYGQQDYYDKLPTDTNYNTRFLYRKWIGNIPQNTLYITTFPTEAVPDFDVVVGQLSGGFPYAGFLNDPYTPTLDLNYGNCKYYFNPNSTSNNLSWKYWRNKVSLYMNPNSKKVTIQLRINPTDIAQLDFRKKIFLFNSLYRLSRIVEWKPNGDSCKVELYEDAALDVNAYISPTVWDINTILGNSPIGNRIIIQPPEPVVYLDMTLSGQTITDPLLLSGLTWKNNNNYISPSSSAIVIGKGNIVNSSGSIIQGNFNQVYSDNVNLINCDNVYVGTGLTNVSVIGASGITITESNFNYSKTSVKYIYDDYTLQTGDANNVIVGSSTGTTIYIRVPINSVTTFQIGTKIDLIQFDNANLYVVAGYAGVNIYSYYGSTITDGFYAKAVLIKIGTDDWIINGELQAP